MSELDPRVNAFRPDLADARLRGQVQAKRFVQPALMRVADSRLAMFAAPEKMAAMSSELRAGELVDVFERRDGLAWVQNRSDQYVGYVAANGLSETLADTAWRIVSPLAYIHPEPDIKTIPQDMVPFPARVAVTKFFPEGWAQLSTGGFVSDRHLEPATQRHSDYVFTAGRLLNAPYLWGGRTAQGIDCSGLVQVALELAGIECPRDSDQQRQAFGAPPPANWSDYPFTRGDIVFFKGHVGMMADATHLLHANSHHMKVTSEPLADVVARGQTILAIGDGAAIRRAMQPERSTQAGKTGRPPSPDL